MEFGLSEEQSMLTDSIRRFADQNVDAEALKSLVDGGEIAKPSLLRGLAELGALGILTPETAGGSGLGLLEACLVQQALGRNAVPVPFTASAILAPLALAETEAAEAWLPRLASGEARVGVGIGEAAGRRSGTGIELLGTKASGSARFVIDGIDADGWILGTVGGGLVLVERDAKGSSCSALTTIDGTRGCAEVTLDAVQATVLLEDGADPSRLARMLAAGRTALAFDTLGACERMLERAVAYALERKQFGRVIGSFQAVKHLCAEMAADLEPCHSLLWYAAYAADAYPDEFELMACHAKAHMGEVGQFIARTSTEVHGGMGFTHEMGLHYFFKRIGVNRQLLGNPDQVRQHAAALQGWRRAG